MVTWAALAAVVLSTANLVLGVPQADNPQTYWRQTLPNRGKATFNTDTSYKVFRDAKRDFGAKGDGVTDDTQALLNALGVGSRTYATSSTTTPAIVYLQPGTYLISRTLILPYYTQLIGSATGQSIIKIVSTWPSGSPTGYVIDADPYNSSGQLSVGSTNNFYKEIRDLTIDMTAATGNANMAGIHWPTAQACQLQNLKIKMTTVSTTQQVGIFIEEGSGGFMSDLTISGGAIGMNVGNQQFEVRGLTFNGCRTAINQLWSWQFLYQGLTIFNCPVGINMGSVDNNGAQTVGSITILDSQFQGVSNAGIITATSPNSQPPTSGSLIIDNTVFYQTPNAVKSTGGAVLLDTSSNSYVSLWGQGHFYSGTDTSPTFKQGTLTAGSKPAGLLSQGNFRTVSRPTYAAYSSNLFASVIALGAKGDGVTDDTATLQNILNSACGRYIVFFDAGAYIVTSTLTIPAGCWVVGEGESVIMARGSTFSNPTAPQVVVKVGNTGDSASTQISGMLFSSTGGTAGAIILEWNVNDSSGSSGMWSSHFRLGGALGTNQNQNCPTSGSGSVAACSAAFMMMRVRGAGYFENVWAWTADHMLDDSSQARINIYTGRGISIETTGPTWFHAVASEHASIYQYQIATSSPFFAGILQSETPYYQPTPSAPAPYTIQASYNDPQVSGSALALRILNSKDVWIYGAGLYSFFSSYTQTCISSRTCQSTLVSIENSTPWVFNLNTIGTNAMITLNGANTARGQDNRNVYPDTIALFSPQGLSVVGGSGSSSSSSSTTSAPGTTVTPRTRPGASTLQPAPTRPAAVTQTPTSSSSIPRTSTSTSTSTSSTTPSTSSTTSSTGMTTPTTMSTTATVRGRPVASTLR